MKVGIITSGNKVNQIRGVGFYSERLVEAITQTDQVEIGFPRFSRWGFGFEIYDLIHLTYFDPFFLTLPLFAPRPMVITIHDLTPLVLPEGFPTGIRGEIKWQIQKKLLLSSKKIITVSKQTKRDLISKTDYPEDNVDVVYEAPGREFRLISERKTLNVAAKKYDLPPKYILYVGDVNYNKNVMGLIRAYSLAREKDPELHLVVIGAVYLENNAPSQVGEIKLLIEELKIGGSVHFKGFVPTADLPSIFNLATVYVQPSIYEGFGLPVVEALACGCPVICGKNSSLIEVGGQAAIYTDVLTPQEFSSSILQVIGLSQDRTKNIKEASVNQAKKFTWEKTAEQTVDLYKSIL